MTFLQLEIFPIIMFRDIFIQKSLSSAARNCALRKRTFPLVVPESEDMNPPLGDIKDMGTLLSEQSFIACVLTPEYVKDMRLSIRCIGTLPISSLFLCITTFSPSFDMYASGEVMYSVFSSFFMLLTVAP
jgi:hypothetical protein